MGGSRVGVSQIKGGKVGEMKHPLLMRPFLVALLISCSLGAWPASAAESPGPSARLYCLDAAGAALPLKTGTFSDLITAYLSKAGWRHSLRALTPTSFQIVFSPSGGAMDSESATFEAEQLGDGIVLKSIDYRIDGHREHVGKGEVCFRLIGVLSP